MNSPYENLPENEWVEVTKKLVDIHPLDTDEIVDVVLEAWEDILKTTIGGRLQIGVDVFPIPQTLGNFLHELIPAILSDRYPSDWRRERDKKDKDLVYIPDNHFSLEIKTSSNASGIYGNKSYAQENSKNNSGKSKSGYYITVNFEKFDSSNPNKKPKIKKIRFGWIDHTDWKPQKSNSGQSAYISKEARGNKLILLYKNK